MVLKTDHDVIIVGAGPIGSYTARLLAEEGLDVGLFEKEPFDRKRRKLQRDCKHRVFSSVRPSVSIRNTGHRLH